MRKLRALIVDDSIVTRGKLNRIIQDLGHEVVKSVKDGKEAVDVCRIHESCNTYEKIDFITMDITMPNMDGVTAVRYIRRMNKHVKIIMVTANDQKDIVMDSIEAGASGYILKPFQKYKLEEVLGKIFFSVV